MLELDRHSDINLKSFRRVAWEGEPDALSDAARDVRSWQSTPTWRGELPCPGPQLRIPRPRGGRRATGRSRISLTTNASRSAWGLRRRARSESMGFLVVAGGGGGEGVARVRRGAASGDVFSSGRNGAPVSRAVGAARGSPPGLHSAACPSSASLRRVRRLESRLTAAYSGDRFSSGRLGSAMLERMRVSATTFCIW